jgi:CheY-like chemotaxis protein
VVRSTAEAGGGPTLLVVDDEPTVREMLGRVLEAEHYGVAMAANGKEALERVAWGDIDLVLLDLNMPAMGGWETFERLTTQEPLLPVVVITARPNQLFTAAGSGVAALLEKPLDYPTLLATVAELLAEPRATREARVAGRIARFHYQGPSSRPPRGGSGGANP